MVRKTALGLVVIGGSAGLALGQVIAAEDFDGGDIGLIGSVVPALDGGPGDYFGVGSRNAWPQGFPDPGVPFSIADDSVFGYANGTPFPGDNEGIYGMNSNLDNRYFAMSDSDEFGGDQTASWTFDIAGFSELGLRIDMGGISNDSFGGYDPALADIVFSVQIDGGAVQTAFDVDAEVFSGQFFVRDMDDGLAGGGGNLLVVGGDNLVNKLLAEDGSLAGNTYVDKSVRRGDGAGELDTFVTAINGEGLELTLTMTANMPFEAYVFDNIAITGVPAPASLALLGLGGLVATRRRR